MLQTPKHQDTETFKQTPTIPTKLAINISLTLSHFMTTALNVIKKK